MRPSRAHVLIVDDNVSMRKVLRRLLGPLGFEKIDEAGDGAEALEAFYHTAFDIVVTDWNMPRLDGIGLLKAIRTAPERSATPVVVVTGDVSVSRVREAIDAGADGFVVKPCIAPAICEKLLHIVEALPPISDPVLAMLEG